MKKSRSAFTIVELLIVIVIIGILAAITVVAYNGITARARDSQRKNDLKSIEKALEFHYVDTGFFSKAGELCTDSSYGAQGTCGNTSGPGDWDTNSDIRDLKTKKYLSSIPVDPKNDSTYNYNYEPWNAGQGGYTERAQAYDLCARLETDGSNYCINRRT